MRLKSPFHVALALSPLIALGGMPALAEDAPDTGASTISEAIAGAKPIFNLRLRYENVDQANIADEAQALTWRARVGFETEKFKDTTFLVDFDFVEDIVDDFNSTTNGKGGLYPVVADPNTSELNRFQLTNTSITDTKVTLGRQRIIMDDARFVGNVGWRQNEQTFDALRVTNTSLGDVTIDAVYLNRVNRIFGDESAGGKFTGDTFLFNASSPTPIGKLTGFAYLVDVDEGGGANSSQTFGVRLAGSVDAGEGKIAYVGSYAKQSDYGSSMLDYDADYYRVTGTYSQGPFSAGLGYEVLGGDTQRGFSTPLATLHAYQGWADKFLGTPLDGVEDAFVNVGYKFGNVGPFEGVSLSAIYHDFKAEQISADYGSEIDIALNAKYKKLALGLKYADYSADTFSVDTSKLWFQVGYNY